MVRKDLTARNGSDVDTTAIRTSSLRGAHRDYVAHCLRYGWARRVIPLGARILDAGCGPDAPVALELFERPPPPELYVGVDLNRIKPRCRPRWAEFRGEFDVIERVGELLDEFGQFDFAVCFEVIEHMSERHQPRFLAALARAVAPGGTLLYSTPNFNGRQAKNHVRELTPRQSRELLDDAGFDVVARYGTFISLRDLYPLLDDATRATYDVAREFYSGDVLSTLLAPPFPDQARNCAWLCRRRDAIASPELIK